MLKLRYGNTNTFFSNGLLLDTDMPGTLPALFKALKQNSLQPDDIRYVLATHYHPDHMGLISELMTRGTKLLLVDTQKEAVHFSDEIFSRQKGLNYKPINEADAVVITCAESRAFLAELGLAGEIVTTESHSADGIALLTDDGCCYVGDLEPLSFAAGYEDSTLLKADWDCIMKHRAGHAPKKVFPAHMPEYEL